MSAVISMPADMIVLNEPQQAGYSYLEKFALGRTDSVLVTLKGYAGTGKTTLIGRLIASLQHTLTIGVAAPTNKAVKVIKEKLEDFGVENFGTKVKRGGSKFDRDEWDGGNDGTVVVGTIHSFLGIGMVEKDDGSQEYTQKRDSGIHMLDVLVIDEASMISPQLFKLILDKRRDCLVIFIGDPAQLPPVDVKAVQSPVFDVVQNAFQLSEVVRQAKDSPIIKTSMAVRAAIEAGHRVTIAEIMAALPEGPGFAGVMYGAHDNIAGFVASERQAGRDCRVLAFYNTRVDAYNEAIHNRIYGAYSCQSCRFAVGEAVIVHKACSANRSYGRYSWAPDGDEDDGCYQTENVQLHTSQELAVTRIDRDMRVSAYPDIAADRVWLDDGDGASLFVYVAQDDEVLGKNIAKLFKESKDMRLRGEAISDYNERDKMLREGKSVSGKAWALKGSFAPLKHAYAMTVHKSQGSTFDTALVDWSDISRMRTDFEFNRAIYTAITRPRKYLAIFA